MANRARLAQSGARSTCLVLVRHYVCFGTALRAGGAPPRPRTFVLLVCLGTALRAGGAPPLYPAFARARHVSALYITEGTPSPPYLLWPIRRRELSKEGLLSGPYRPREVAGLQA